MLFRDGTQLTQVGSLAEMTSANTFYYDWSAKTLHINFNPSTASVYASKYAQAMALYKPTNFSIKGIGFRRYASNQMHNATSGAVLLNQGSKVLIENSALVENAGNGLQSWQTADLTLRRSVIADNGATGFNFEGNWVGRAGAATPTDNVTIEYSRLDHNNLDRYGVNCTWSCGAAGAKLTDTFGVTVRYSSFSSNGGGRGSGLWCDLGCKDLVAIGNVFIDNDRHGLIYEISNKGIIASNLFVGNGEESPINGGGFGMYVGSANVKIYNNTLVNNRRGIGLYDDSRTAPENTGGFAAARIGLDTVNTEVVNNIVTGGDSVDGMQLSVLGGNPQYSGNTTASEAIAKLTNNSFHRPANGSKYWVTWTESVGATTALPATMEAFRQSTGLGANSELSTATANPYLTDVANKDYSVKSGSTAAGPVTSRRCFPVVPTPVTVV